MQGKMSRGGQVSIRAQREVLVRCQWMMMAG